MTRTSWAVVFTSAIFVTAHRNSGSPPDVGWSATAASHHWRQRASGRTGDDKSSVGLDQPLGLPRAA